MSTPTVHFVLGKPPLRSPVLPQVLELLEAAGLRVGHQAPRSVEQLDTDALDDAALVVLRGLSAPLLQALEPWADRCLDRPEAIAALPDRPSVIRRLSEAGLPVPRSRLVTEWSTVLEAPSDWVVKAADGARGRSAGVLLTGQERPPRPPFEGPWMLQERVGGSGAEAKLYVAGEQVRGLRRPIGATSQPGSGVELLPQVSPPLVDLARVTAGTLGLRLCGVDVLVSAPDQLDSGRGSAMHVVDVNAFPSAAAIPDAAPWYAGYLARAAQA